MTIEETVKLRLSELRAELSMLEKQHELMLKRLQANQIACHQLTGGIAELEQLQKLSQDSEERIPERITA